jgi:hypothetical protein
MQKLALPAALAIAALALTGCSKKAQNEANDAAEAVAADVNVTTAEAINDVDAASAAAFGAAENSIDAASNAADKAGKKAKRAADAAIEE